jgi:ATP-dependent DNA helicase RecQ
MRNQIEAAERLGVCAKTINSANRENWGSIKREILSGEADAILISPERFADESFVQQVLLPVSDRIGLFVVDEAHCISDWGHDFRPDYKRLAGVLKELPPNLPLLCTTATANDRVICDVSTQLGNVEIQRGSLVRKGLILQTLRLPDQASRLAWLAHYIPKLPGTGIVYTLTIRDAERVADWLKSQGIEARAYYSNVKSPDFDDINSYRQHLEAQLLHNKLKALVATTALSMGYDKPDLGFVIHYQAPSSVISYYQQVGRAGRGIDKAYGVLLYGKEDDEIHAHYRKSAFPDSRTVERLLAELTASDGLPVDQLAKRLNLPDSQVDHALKMLSVEIPAPVILTESKWQRRPVAYRLDDERVQRLSRQRAIEWQQVQSYVDSKTCLMSFLQTALDDPEVTPCGRCTVCRGKPVISDLLDQTEVDTAKRFLHQPEIRIFPKVQTPGDAFLEYEIPSRIPNESQAQEGRVLSRWNDTGWGRIVAADKNRGFFRDELVDALAEMIEQRWHPVPKPQWVTCVPSRRHPDLVPNFAYRLATKLHLPYLDVIAKVRDNEPQKIQQNSFRQCRNLDGIFKVSKPVPTSPVLLIDDMIDSGWTATVLAFLLSQAGAGPVFPVALASTGSHR